MNAQLLERSRSSQATPETQAAVRHRSAHPPNLLDRVALRAGLALIVWSRRSVRPAPDREDLARSRAARVAREQRERGYESRHALVVVER